MKYLRKLLLRSLWLCAVWTVVQGPARAADLLPVKLRELAATAMRRETWPRLRSYAQSHTDSEWSGWAYLATGYEEFQAQRYADASQDLAQAAHSGFALADFAVFYQATALSQDNRPQEAAAALQDFDARFPHSQLHLRALALRANCLLDTHQPELAADALEPEPQIRKIPSLALLYAQACVQAHHRMEAALAFQSLYYNLPASSQAKTAGDALGSIAADMGTDYPIPNTQLRTARAEALYNAGHYDDALKEFRDLLTSHPESPLLPSWSLGQGRCLLRLHRSADALQALFTRFDSPDWEAQRMALLVQVHAQQSDSVAITQDLAFFETTQTYTDPYADALSAAGGYYYRQLNWQEAARAYQRLYELFPESEHMRDDGWKLAWCYYLLHDARAADVISAYLTAYPDSARAPAALFWLGRIEEERGQVAEARAVYALLTQRFIHTYYAPQGATRLSALRTRPVDLARSDQSGSAPVVAALISALPPPAPPQGLACVAVAPNEIARSALILREFGLQSLEEEFLHASLGMDRPPAELRLLLAEIYARENNPGGALFTTLRTVPHYSQMPFSELPKEVWDLLYPQMYWRLIQTQARLNHLDPYLVMGLVRQESAFNAGALSSANARGLMQVLPQTAARTNRTYRVRIAARRLYDPAYNVRTGCAYLAWLLKEFDNRPELAVAAYNAGDFRVRDWLSKSSTQDPKLFLESIPIAETRSYTELVLRDAEVYRQLMGGSLHFAHCGTALTLSRPEKERAAR